MPGGFSVIYSFWIAQIIDLHSLNHRIQCSKALDCLNGDYHYKPDVILEKAYWLSTAVCEILLLPQFDH